MSSDLKHEMNQIWHIKAGPFLWDFKYETLPQAESKVYMIKFITDRRFIGWHVEMMSPRASILLHIYVVWLFGASPFQISNQCTARLNLDGASIYNILTKWVPQDLSLLNLP